MNQFWVPDLESKQRCDASRYTGRADTFSSVDVLRGTVEIYTGVVQSVEDFGQGAPEGSRWRVTLRPVP
jgi:hypothetical protein